MKTLAEFYLTGFRPGDDATPAACWNVSRRPPARGGVHTGQLKIRELRARATQRLGEHFASEMPKKRVG
jgi:hypothetical protein